MNWWVTLLLLLGLKPGLPARGTLANAFVSTLDGPAVLLVQLSPFAGKNWVLVNEIDQQTTGPRIPVGTVAEIVTGDGVNFRGRWSGVAFDPL